MYLNNGGSGEIACPLKVGLGDLVSSPCVKNNHIGMQVDIIGLKLVRSEASRENAISG
jgi:hypothetical protein